MTTRHISLLASAVGLGLLAAALHPAVAALPKGAHAPDFATQGARAGKPFAFRLGEALKHGPVVLYFYPKAFTSGCTMEAHAFAAAIPQFRAAGASVLGLSADDLPTLEKFSTQECSNAFPVATASPQTIAAYDARLTMVGAPTGLADRITYVIAPDGQNRGKIVMAYAAMDWKEHVPRALAAVKAITGK